MSAKIEKVRQKHKGHDRADQKVFPGRSG